ncbi:hypothetical protein [Nocardia iowensis]|uniref:Excreted virulence factor EspC (Type VII ESX diderm) n=1 Tax=Nocardia iowensis TaxID=204891 RepID=A0ABX8RUN8_NOCIO|nr:hypothetical protein [Nocardia iowensis]QXN92612.1 hypothetical protein KV110_05585 [Nocardia iowensis]
MAGSELVGVETGELGRLANELSASGQAVRNRAKDVADNMFGPADAGENYADHGRKIQTGLETIYKWLGNWSEATLATGDVVGASVVKYSNTDQETSFDIAKLGDGSKA